MWCPNLVLTGTEVWPFSSSKAAFSNSLTILPLVKVPRSPPFLPEGHKETCWATAPNFSPLSMRDLAFFASVSVLTSIWQQCTLSGIIKLKCGLTYNFYFANQDIFNRKILFNLFCINLLCCYVGQMLMN